VKNMTKTDAQRFGGEFGPVRNKETKGVSLSTFKSLVWTSNLGGLILVAISLELFTKANWIWATVCLISGIVIALFPSNYEIVGMEEIDENKEEEEEEN